MRKLIRVAGTVAAVGVIVLVVGAGALFALSNRKLNQTFDLPGHTLAIPVDSASLTEGERLAHAWGCVDCHGDDLGGKVLIDAAPMGVLPAPNLTAGQGGIGSSYGPSDWERALRHGVGGDGRGLLVMPSSDYRWVSDADLGRVVAWVTSRPPVDRELPPRRAGPVMRGLVVSGGLPLMPGIIPEHDHGAVVAPPRAASVEYGRYLSVACSGCHGAAFAGGVVAEPGVPPSRNLTPSPQEGIGSWTLSDFSAAVREGRRPDGTQLVPQMPYSAFSYLEDDEIEALWLFLRTIPARETGDNTVTP